MQDFVPPFPARPPQPLSAIATLRLARRNFLAIWEDRCFEWEVFSSRLLAQTLFVCNSPDTATAAFIEHHDSFERKSPQMRHGLAPILGDGLFISDGDTWRRRRRIIAPIIHASRMPLFAPIMVQATNETAERWAESGSITPINALTEMAALTAEIICRAVFGRQLGATKAAEIIAAFTQYQRLVGQLDLLYFLGLPDWLPRFHSPAIRRAARQLHLVLDQVIRECREQLCDGEASMIRLLLEARDSETDEPLDDVAVRNEAAVIFLAGHETTANSLAWTWYLLSQAPMVEERLHAELARVLAGRPPTLEDVPNLPYTRAVFEETLRLYPPVPLLARQASRGETIRGRRVAAGSLVMVVPWLLHRHRKFWGKPDHYIPERFLPENAQYRVRHAYLPFSVGPRICAGATFGQTEAILCLATLAQRVRLRLAPGTIVEPVCRLTLRPGDDLRMLVEARV